MSSDDKASEAQSGTLSSPANQRRAAAASFACTSLLFHERRPPGYRYLPQPPPKKVKLPSQTVPRVLSPQSRQGVAPALAHHAQGTWVGFMSSEQSGLFLLFSLRRRYSFSGSLTRAPRCWPDCWAVQIAFVSGHTPRRPTAFDGIPCFFDRGTGAYSTYLDWRVASSTRPAKDIVPTNLALRAMRFMLHTCRLGGEGYSASYNMYTVLGPWHVLTDV